MRWAACSAAAPAISRSSRRSAGRIASSSRRSRRGGRPSRAPAIGSRLSRLDGLPKLSGSDLYGADRAPEDALWLRALRCPHPRARFTLGDVDGFVAARPGLVRVFTAADVPGENSFGIYPPSQGPAGLLRRRNPLSRRMRAGHRRRARGGRGGEDRGVPDLWEPLPALTGVEAALAEGAYALHDFAADNVLTRGRVERGDVEAGFRGSGPYRLRRLPHRLRRTRLYRARGRLCQARGRGHRDLRLYPGALYGPRRGGARARPARSSASASCPRPAAAASAASSTCRSSRCWRSLPGCWTGRCAASSAGRNR